MRISDWSSDVCSSDLAGTRKPIARILQYVAHPTAIDEDPRIPHADYIFGLAERLERDGGVALYYNGPIADASGAGGDCTYADPNAYEQVRCRGEAIANFALALNSRPLKPELSIRNVEVTRSEEHTSELQSLMRHS